MNAPLLEVHDLTMRFGGVTAIDALSFTAQKASITSLIGPNGAGKTTVFNCLTGFYKPTEGRIQLQSEKGQLALHNLVGHKINTTGKVARTFQNIRLFGKMTVLENLLVAQHGMLHQSWRTVVGGLWNSRSYRLAEARAVKKAGHWLERLGLEDMADIEAASLPYGDMRRLEIGRAMCTDPILLCLDEPAAGLNARESSDLSKLLTTIRDEYDVGILLVEHDMSVVMDISDHVIVIDYGKLISQGLPDKVKNDPAVIQAYLGAEDDEELDETIASDIAKPKGAV